MRLLAFLVALAMTTSALAAGGDRPLPRFVSLAADEINLRTGPGRRYPVTWVFVREAMPVEVMAEFEQWRRVRDFEGAEGWVHQAMLSARRTVLVVGNGRVLHREPEAGAAPVARTEARVQGTLHGCRGNWCEVTLQGLRGWMRRSHLWGVYADETPK